MRHGRDIVLHLLEDVRDDLVRHPEGGPHLGDDGRPLVLGGPACRSLSKTAIACCISFSEAVKCLSFSVTGKAATRPGTCRVAALVMARSVLCLPLFFR